MKSTSTSRSFTPILPTWDSGYRSGDGCFGGQGYVYMSGFDLSTFCSLVIRKVARASECDETTVQKVDQTSRSVEERSCSIVDGVYYSFLFDTLQRWKVKAGCVYNDLIYAQDRSAFGRTSARHANLLRTDIPSGSKSVTQSKRLSRC